MNGARRDFIVPLQLLVTSETVWEERSTREDSWLHSAGWLIRVIKRTRRRRRFDVSCEKVRRVRRGGISTELLMCGEGVRSILLLPLEARCIDTIDVCIWRMFVFMSVVVTM